MKHELSNDQIEALKQVIGGADILGYQLAKLLREIEKNAPELIHICSCAGTYDVMDKRPYFGAITTKKGVEYLNNLTIQQ